MFVFTGGANFFEDAEIERLNAELYKLHKEHENLVQNFRSDLKDQTLKERQKCTLVGFWILCSLLLNRLDLHSHCCQRGVFERADPCRTTRKQIS